MPPLLVRGSCEAISGKAPGAWAFTAPHGGSPRHDNFRHRVFDPAVAAAGLAGLGATAHKSQHTAVSPAIASEADVKVVRTVLGHYGHLLPAGSVGSPRR